MTAIWAWWVGLEPHHVVAIMLACAVTVGLACEAVGAWARYRKWVQNHPDRKTTCDRCIGRKEE